MKIVLVSPFHHSIDLTIPIGVLTLASILKINRYLVEIVDLDFLYSTNTLKKHIKIDDNFLEISNYLISREADIIGFSCMENCHHINPKTSKLVIKKSQLKILN